MEGRTQGRMAGRERQGRAAEGRRLGPPVDPRRPRDDVGGIAWCQALEEPQGALAVGQGKLARDRAILDQPFDISIRHSSTVRSTLLLYPLIGSHTLRPIPQ